MYGVITIDGCRNTGRVFRRCVSDRVYPGVHDRSPAASFRFWDIQGSEFFEYKKIVPDAVRKGVRLWVVERVY